MIVLFHFTRNWIKSQEKQRILFNFYKSYNCFWKYLWIVYKKWNLWVYFCSQKCFCIQHFYQVIFKINILIRTNIDGKTDSALLDFCKNEQIQVEVYFPIAHREALKNSVITKMAAKYGVSAAQLCIRYGLQLGTIALPKTANPETMQI